jgi:hypothetical protein
MFSMDGKYILKVKPSLYQTFSCEGKYVSKVKLSLAQNFSMDGKYILNIKLFLYQSFSWEGKYIFDSRSAQINLQADIPLSSQTNVIMVGEIKVMQSINW